jgi:AcrR family transcriptional regulator
MSPVKLRRKGVRRPKQKRSQVMVSTIIAAGTRVLARDGWEGFTTNAVAERAGVSIGSVYEYFRDKQALVDAIADEHIGRGEQLLAQASALVASHRELTDLVNMLVDGAIALHADDPALHRVLSSEVPLGKSVRARVVRLRAGFVRIVEPALTGCVSEPFVSAQLLVDVSDAIIHRWWVEDDGELADPQRLSDELKLMLLAYLKTPGR